ncbi:MAG: methylmalonyl-CoA mutase family protein [Ekhidna sp.]|uniref:methylmalonyl-CoA mutase family protein n=1 Tax=Ekhidna sp. TaxID=2608089 RepID=UPI0032EA9CF3
MKNLDLTIFPPIPNDEWKQLAERQLKGANPDEELSWKNEAGIELKGYYDASDLEPLRYLADFFTTLPSHRWKLYEEVSVRETKFANQQVLKALMGGCDGVILKVSNVVELEEATSDVNIAICDICTISDEALSTKYFSGFQIMPNGNCFRAKDVENPIDQISEVISGLLDHSYIYRHALSDFFLEIAAVRALRFLLNQRGSNANIHTHVPLHHSKDHQWFLNTTAGLASILGGSHSIDFSTAIGDSRISRNTGNLIREESGIEEYKDQCGGSYYIEVLTDKIIKGVEEKLRQ